MKNRNRLLWTFSRQPMFKYILWLVCISLATPALGYNLPRSKGGIVNSDQVAALQKISQGISDVAKATSKAVVFVSVSKTANGLPRGMVDPFEFFFGPGFRRQQPRKAPRQEGVGSGFIVDLDKGYVITNNHVIESAEEIELKMANGETYAGKIVGRDKNTDIAVVQIKDKKFKKAGLSALALGDSTSVAVGHFVLALGAPFRLEASVSFGTVSAIGRDNLGITTLGNFIQTDAAINPGNSGGPLVNTKGEVIGVNTAIYSTSGAYAGIGFAVPSNLARRIAEQLINDGEVKRGYLGVGLQKLDDEIAEGLDLPKGQKGALVNTVEKNSPASKAGFEPGDVITQVNGKGVKSVQQLINTIGLMKPGSKVDLTYYRYGKKKTAQVKLGGWEKQVAKNSGKGGKDKPSESTFGLAVRTLTSQLKSQYRSSANQGVIVTKVETNSPADRAGLQEGDVVVMVNGKQVTDVKGFLRQLKSKKRPLLRCERNGQFFFAALN